MKTEKHPRSERIHYAVGGVITSEKSEFRTLCGRVFQQGHDAIMRSGYAGALAVTCKPCRAKLDAQVRFDKKLAAHDKKRRQIVAEEVRRQLGRSNH